MQSTNKIAFFNILSTLILQGLTFFTSPIISRLLGTENYGIASVYVTWVAIFSAVFGLQTQSTIAIARNEFSKSEQRAYQSSIMSLSIFSYSIFTLLILMFLRPLSLIMKMDTPMILCVLLQGFGQFVITFVNVKFTYEFKAKYNFYMTLIISMSTLLLSVVFIHYWEKNSNYWGRILGQLIPYLLTGIVVVTLLFWKGKILYSNKYWKFCLPLCIPIVFHNISNLILNQSDRVMIQQMIGNSEAGIYSLAYSFGSVLSSVWNALNNSWVPFYYEYTRKKEIKDMKVHAAYYLELFTVLASGFVLVFKEVFCLFAGKDFWNGGPLIFTFSLGFYFMFLYSFPVNYEFFHKKTSIIACGTCLSAICNIILNYYLIRIWGINGAAIATSISYMLQFIFHYFFASSVIGKKDFPFPLRQLLKYLGIFIVFIVLSISMDKVNYLRWALGCGIGIWELYRIKKRRAIF